MSDRRRRARFGLVAFAVLAAAQHGINLAVDGALRANGIEIASALTEAAGAASHA